MIKNAGFDGTFIQWYNKEWEVGQQEQLDFCRKLGLEIYFVHLGYSEINTIWKDGEEGDNLVEKYLRDLDQCKANNIDLVVMHLTSKYEVQEPNLLGINRFQKIVDYAEKLNIRIAFENTKVWGFLEYLFDHIKNQNIGICFDSGHYHCHFDDKFNWDLFKNKILAVHLHDNDKSSDQHLLPFDGSIDWKNVVDNLKSANYKGPVILETKYVGKYLDTPVDEFYKISYQRAKEIM
jgi:sugar phosphate isomerase/epimerase